MSLDFARDGQRLRRDDTRCPARRPAPDVIPSVVEGQRHTARRCVRVVAHVTASVGERPQRSLRLRHRARRREVRSWRSLDYARDQMGHRYERVARGVLSLDFARDDATLARSQIAVDEIEARRVPVIADARRAANLEKRVVLFVEGGPSRNARTVRIAGRREARPRRHLEF
jgi:hypothetical protein